MRIVISSPPKMGNKWLKCLLSRVYNLQWIIGEDSPNTNPDKFRQFVDLLDAPPEHNPGLERLLAVKPLWDKG